VRSGWKDQPSQAGALTFNCQWRVPSGFIVAIRARPPQSAVYAIRPLRPGNAACALGARSPLATTHARSVAATTIQTDCLSTCTATPAVLRRPGPQRAIGAVATRTLAWQMTSLGFIVQ
jgi:hypothetical protein